jgi:nucleoside-diphosphate-sugar epimerase
MITAAGREDLWNSFLHAPTAAPVTQQRLVEMVAAAGGVAVPRTSAIPPWVLRASGVVSREMRELAETSYMFTEPFVMDSTTSEERLDLAPTPMTDGLARTVAWWREQERSAA